MNRGRILSMAIALAVSVASWAQQSDSLAFINAEWEVRELDKGITLKQYHFTGENMLFDSNQYISIIEIDSKRAGGRFTFANDPGKITPTSKFAKDSGAVVAMNGTFYNMRPPYNCVCYFKKNGVETFANTEKMEQRDNGAVVIDKKGRISVVAADPANPGNIMPQSWAAEIKAPSVMCSGPLLLVDGKAARLDDNSFNKNRHPRSAVATKGKKIYLIAVDGRSKENAQGVSLWEFTSIMRYLGVDDAINLDGGGSTTLYAEGENENGILNHPSDNKIFDREGERQVVNSLLFIKKK